MKNPVLWALAVVIVTSALALKAAHAIEPEQPPASTCEQDLRSTSEYAGLVRVKRDAQIVEEEMEIARLRARVWFLEKEILRRGSTPPAAVLIP